MPQLYQTQLKFKRKFTSFFQNVIPSSFFVILTPNLFRGKNLIEVKVHLSSTIEDAIAVGRRKTENPVIFKIDAKRALAEGVRIENASDKVYVAQEIPKEFIAVVD